MRVWLQAYIRRLQPTLRALRGFAKNGLYSPARFERSASIRLLFLRSNLSRHHIVLPYYRGPSHEPAASLLRKSIDDAVAKRGRELLEYRTAPPSGNS
jgi:hypothetical protein